MPLQEVRHTLRFSQASELLPSLLDRRSDVLDGGWDDWISCGPCLDAVQRSGGVAVGKRRFFLRPEQSYEQIGRANETPFRQNSSRLAKPILLYAASEPSVTRLKK